jgi:hypothetical protein
MTDEELKEYLESILETTLALNDGTRVKTLYIEWEGLTANQRQLAIEIIKYAAISELNQLRDNERLRFEFNEIPGELEEMFLSISDADNEDIQWIQIDMDIDMDEDSY